MAKEKDFISLTSSLSLTVLCSLLTIVSYVQSTITYGSLSEPNDNSAANYIKPASTHTCGVTIHATYFYDKTEKTAYVIDTVSANPTIVLVNRTGNIVASITSGGGVAYSSIINYYANLVIFSPNHQYGYSYYPQSYGNPIVFVYYQHTGAISIGFLAAARGGMQSYQFVFCLNNVGSGTYKTSFYTQTIDSIVQLNSFYVNDAIISFNGYSMFISDWSTGRIMSMELVTIASYWISATVNNRPVYYLSEDYDTKYLHTASYSNELIKYSTYPATNPMPATSTRMFPHAITSINLVNFFQFVIVTSVSVPNIYVVDSVDYTKPLLASSSKKYITGTFSTQDAVCRPDLYSSTSYICTFMSASTGPNYVNPQVVMFNITDETPINKTCSISNCKYCSRNAWICEYCQDGYGLLYQYNNCTKLTEGPAMQGLNIVTGYFMPCHDPQCQVCSPCSIISTILPASSPLLSPLPTEPTSLLEKPTLAPLAVAITASRTTLCAISASRHQIIFTCTTTHACSPRIYLTVTVQVPLLPTCQQNAKT